MIVLEKMDLEEMCSAAPTSVKLAIVVSELISGDKKVSRSSFPSRGGVPLHQNWITSTPKFDLFYDFAGIRIFLRV